MLPGHSPQSAPEQRAGSRRLLTFFARFEPLFAYKDVGGLPYHLAIQCGWNCSLAYFQDAHCLKEPEDWFVKGVTPISLGKRRGQVRDLLRAAQFLYENAGKYDVVNFYHDTPVTLFLALICRASHPSGRVYVKLDMSHLEVETILRGESRGISFPCLARILRRLVSRLSVDLYTVESTPVFRTLARTRYYQGRLQYLPNGFTCTETDKVGELVDRKDNLILTVGRLGAVQKHNELLLEALGQISPPLLDGWKVLLVGPIANPGFRMRVQETLAAHPRLENILSLHGEVADRDALYNLYKRSRIYCHTARWESFGIVLAEAMYFGNYVISTELPAARDLTAEGSLGALYPVGDAEELRHHIEDAISGKVDLAAKGIASHHRIREHFDWREIVKDLDRMLRDLCRDPCRDRAPERQGGYRMAAEVVPIPLVSVCIPVFNGERYVGDAIRSVLRQGHPRLEIVVQDNASTDGTWALLESLAADHPEVVPHRNPSNIGMAPNWNVAIDRARGDYLMLLSADDTLEPGFLAACLETFRRHHPDAVTTNHFWAAGGGRKRRTMPVAAGGHRKFARTVLLLNPFSINFTLFPKGTIDRIRRRGKLFSETYLTCDYDLWIRLAFSGMEVRYLEEPLGCYRIHETNLSAQFRKMYRHTVMTLLDHREELKRACGTTYRLTMLRFMIRLTLNRLEGRPFDRRLFRVALREFVG